MANKSWVRPESLPYPNVWCEFTKTDKNGKVINFEIRDIAEDLFTTCIAFMTKYFLPDEPFYTSLGFLNDELSVKEQQEWWTKILPEKLSLVCLVKDNSASGSKEPQIAGINFLYYHHKSHDAAESELKGEKMNAVCDIVTYIEDQINRYDLLQIEDYIDEFGLCVHPDYRGIGIATELLKARTHLGKAVGIKSAFTMFTAIGSQKAADKAGYRNLVEMKYSDLAKVFPSHNLNIKGTPTIRYMCKSFSDI